MITINFEIMLLWITIISGIFWLIDVVFFAPKRRRAVRIAMENTYGRLDKYSRDKILKPMMLVDILKALFPVFLIVLGVRSFLVEPYKIPSGSLKPTLLVNDFILVNKFDYGIRLPIKNNKIMDVGEPKKGDVIVFRYPKNPKVDFIKRVIGVPGDKISYVGKRLYINDELIEAGETSQEQHDGLIALQENLDGVLHDIYLNPNVPAQDFHDLEVPDGMYFVMGDNRDNSDDSRDWGFVPEQNLVGRASFIWMSWNGKDKSVRWHRIGKEIN